MELINNYQLEVYYRYVRLEVQKHTQLSSIKQKLYYRFLEMKAEYMICKLINCLFINYSVCIKSIKIYVVNYFHPF